MSDSLSSSPTYTNTTKPSKRRAAPRAETEPVFNVDLDNEIVRHLPDPDAWAELSAERFDPALILDECFRDIYRWAEGHLRDHGQAPTAAVLRAEFELDELGEPETAIGDLIDRLRKRYMNNEGREALMEIGQAWRQNSTQVPKLLIKEGERLSSLGIGSTSSVFASQTTDLAQLVEDGVPEVAYLPTPSLGDEQFYAHNLAILAGHKKSGKSWTETIKAADLISAGRHVVYIDQENGPEVFAERLEHLVETDAIREQFHYVPFPERLPPLEGLRNEIEQIAEMWPDCLLILDSMRTFMARYGLDPNRDVDVERFLGPLMGAIKNRPPESLITVDVIDHSNRTTQGGDAYVAAGSFAKACGVDVVYFFELCEPFSCHQQGQTKLTAVDDRRGRLIKATHYSVGGQGRDEPIHWEILNPSTVGIQGRIKTDIIEYLASKPEETCSKREVRKAIKGDNNTIDAALNWLVLHDPEIHAVKVSNGVRYQWSPPKREIRRGRAAIEEAAGESL